MLICNCCRFLLSHFSSLLLFLFLSFPPPPPPPLSSSAVFPLAQVHDAVAFNVALIFNLLLPKLLRGLFRFSMSRITKFAKVHACASVCVSFFACLSSSSSSHTHTHRQTHRHTDTHTHIQAHALVEQKVAIGVVQHLLVPFAIGSVATRFLECTFIGDRATPLYGVEAAARRALVVVLVVAA